MLSSRDPLQATLRPTMAAHQVVFSSRDWPTGVGPTTVARPVTPAEIVGYASVDGDTLRVTISNERAGNQPAASLPMELHRTTANVVARPRGAVAAAPPAIGGGGDARLVGHWIHQDMIGGGEASLISEEHMWIRADGTYTYSDGATVGGGSSWSYEGGGKKNTVNGRWRTSDDVLFLLDQNGQWVRLGTYATTTDGSTTRVTYDRGGRKLWERR